MSQLRDRLADTSMRVSSIVSHRDAAETQADVIERYMDDLRERAERLEAQSEEIEARYEAALRKFMERGER